MAGIAMAPGHHERLRLVFATSDSDALTDIGQELAPAFFISLAPDSAALFRSLEEHAPEVVVIDLDTIVPDTQDVFAYVESIRAAAPAILLIVISRTPLRNARQRTKKSGGDEFLLAPVDFSELREYLIEAGEERRRSLQAQQFRDEIAQKSSFSGMIGGSEAMQRVYDAVRRVAPSNTTVMLRGESGTGKELAARAIVSLSPRRSGAFISVNCAALPETLMESELFGHEKGSFTGAHATRPGQVELADGGTLFLDEIGSLGLALQSKLLRVLQEHSVQRIGAKHPRKIDFRLITATNDNLEEMVKNGQFREDLYYRICVIPIPLPPLREREGDVPLLLDHYMRMQCVAAGLPLKRFSPEAMQVLETSSWPGNVRELENLTQRLALMVDADLIEVQHLPEKVLMAATASNDHILIPSDGVDLDDELIRIELAYLEAAIRRAGSKRGAASLLRIPVQKMKYLCRKHGI
ncbi:MAG TPA: sigma-54 dependent transcriptional regulator [Acidobacteriaceae bacterium]|jgi:two-component system response regulator PilR (NtrC family)|nr:sigma-54 dependent transcriptional regulator [Acidobacteriaceae bacterium]